MILLDLCHITLLQSRDYIPAFVIQRYLDSNITAEDSDRRSSINIVV